jgi:hypothetical protein
MSLNSVDLAIAKVRLGRAAIRTGIIRSSVYRGRESITIGGRRAPAYIVAARGWTPACVVARRIRGVWQVA